MPLQVLQFVHGVVALLAAVPMAEVALQLFLQAAYTASQLVHRETLAYEFFEQVRADWMRKQIAALTEQSAGLLLTAALGACVRMAC